MVKLLINLDDRLYEVLVDPRYLAGDCIPIQVNGQQLYVNLSSEVKQTGASGVVWVDGRTHDIQADPCLHWIRDSDGLHQVEIHVAQPDRFIPNNCCGCVYAPIPGQVTRVLVQTGQEVEAAEPLIIFEAMKMQNEVCSPRTGVVKQVNVAAGQNIARGDLLVEVE